MKKAILTYSLTEKRIGYIKLYPLLHSSLWSADNLVQDLILAVGRHIYI